MDGATLANHILINSGSESEVDLIGNLGASPGWIALFHLDDSANQIGRWTFGDLVLFAAWAKTTIDTFVEPESDGSSTTWMA